MIKNNIVRTRLMGGLLLLSTFAICSAQGETPLKFDFGPPDQAIAKGFKGVTGKDTYAPNRGHGWLKAWGISYERAEEKDLLSRDGICARNSRKIAPKENDVTFRVDVPNGLYSVTLWLGDASRTEGRKGMCAATNGRTVLPAPGVGGWGKVTKRTIPAVVKNGVLEIRLFVQGDSSSHRLSILALTVAQVTAPTKIEQLRRKWEEQGTPAATKEIVIDYKGKKLKIVGQRHEPPLGTLPKLWQTRPLITFTRRNPGDILDYSIPRISEIRNRLDAFAVPNDDQPFWLGVHALRDLEDVRVHCSDFVSKEGRIFNWDVELFTLTSRPRLISNSTGSIGKIVCDLMEKNFPFNLKRGKSQPIYLRVRIPKGQTPGRYQARLTLSPAAMNPVTVTLGLVVLPLKLQRPKDRIWHLFTDSSRWFNMSQRAMYREIEDMARHGINSLSCGYPPITGAYIEKDGKIVDADLSVVGDGLRHAAKVGIGGPLFGPPTPGVLFRFRGWVYGHSEGATHTYIPEGKGRAISLNHPQAKSSSSLGMNAATPFTPGEPVRLTIRYKSEGKIGGIARVGFMKTYKRHSVKEGAVGIRLEATGGKWRILSAITTTPADARYGRTSMDISGAGTLCIDEIRMVGRDGLANYIVNGGFDRNIDRVDILKPEWPKEFMGDFVDALSAIGKSVERCGFTPWIVGTDESGANPKTEHRELNELRAAKKTGYKIWCNVSPEFAEKAGNLLDIVCHYTSFLGGEAGCRRLVKLYHETNRQLHLISSGCYVGQENDLMPNRHGVGLAFWKSGADGTALWTFQRPIEDPFNDFDGPFKDYCMVFPPRKKGGDPVPTLGWEGVREGWKDYKYVATLENALAEADKAGRKDAAATARTVLDFIRSSVPWFDEAEDAGFDNQSADRMRWLAAWGTMKAKGVPLKSAKAAPVTGKAPTRLATKYTAKQGAKAEPILLCPPTKAAPILDGKLDDAIWAKAGKVTEFYNYKQPGVAARQKTHVYMLHDAENLYLGFRCHEPDMANLKATATGIDAAVWGDDNVEFFLNTSNDEFNFYQFAFNAAGGRFDMRCAGANDSGGNIFAVDYDKKKVRDQKWNGDWSVKTSRHADRWEAEVVVPLKTIGRDSDLWGVHFARSRKAGKPETSTWKVIGMFHTPHKFGKMLLGGARVGQTEITKLGFPSPRFGLDALNMALLHGDGLTAETTITDLRGGEASYQSKVAGGRAELAYALPANAKMQTVILKAGKGKIAYRLARRATVEEPIQIRSGRKVFFSGDRRGVLTIDVQVSAKAQKKAKLVSILRDGAGKDIARTGGSLEGDRCQLAIDMSGLAEGAYELELSLEGVQKGQGAFTHKVGLIVVPHFREVF
jgi:Beta-agarase/YXIM esterase-like, galactose-binding domain-like/Carbohydrate family 9 binding domain-like